MRRLLLVLLCVSLPLGVFPILGGPTPVQAAQNCQPDDPTCTPDQPGGPGPLPDLQCGSGWRLMSGDPRSSITCRNEPNFSDIELISHSGFGPADDPAKADGSQKLQLLGGHQEMQTKVVTRAGESITGHPYQFDLNGWVDDSILADYTPILTEGKRSPDAFSFYWQDPEVSDWHTYVILYKYCQKATQHQDDPQGPKTFHCDQAAYAAAVFDPTAVDKAPEGKRVLCQGEFNDTNCIEIQKWLDRWYIFKPTIRKYFIRDIVKAEGKLSGKLVQHQQKQTQISGILGQIINFFEDLTNQLLNLIAKLMKGFGIIYSGPMGQDPGLHAAWAFCRDIANVFFLLILLVIAFTNVARFNIEYYALRALLPRFLGAIILVNFSLIISQVLIDSADVFTRAFLAFHIPGMDPTLDIFSDPQGHTEEIATLGAWIIVLLVSLFAALALWIALVVRIVMVWFLVIVSPVAFFANVLPGTRSLSQSWWKQFIRFVFMAPAIAFILKIGQIIANVASKADSGGTLLMAPMFAAVTIAVAAAIPLLLGGKIMGMASGRYKQGLGVGAKALPFRRTTKSFVGRYTRGREQAAERMAARISGGAAAMTGGRIGMQNAHQAEVMAQAGKINMDHLSTDEKKLYINRYGARHPKGIAAARSLAGQGALDQKQFNAFAHDAQVVESTRKNRPDLLLGHGDKNLRGLGEATIKNASAETMGSWGSSVWGQDSALWDHTDSSTGQKLTDSWSQEQYRQAFTARETNNKVTGANTLGRNSDKPDEYTGGLLGAIDRGQLTNPAAIEEANNYKESLFTDLSPDHTPTPPPPETPGGPAAPPPTTP